jgi:hypothetical protein
MVKWLYVNHILNNYVVRNFLLTNFDVSMEENFIVDPPPPEDQVNRSTTIPTVLTRGPGK